MSLPMCKVSSHCWLIFTCLITYEFGSDAYRISNRNSTSESSPPGGLYALMFPQNRAPLLKEVQQQVVEFPDSPPLQQGNVTPTEDTASVAKSNFTWSVDDPPSGNSYGHQESRAGDKVHGSYYALLPDGRVQEVEYHVSPTTGYVATIRYSEPGEDTTTGDAGVGEGREDTTEDQTPSETTDGRGGLEAIPAGTGVSITFIDEQPAGSHGNLDNLDNLSGDFSNVGNEEDENGHGFNDGQPTDTQTGNTQPNSGNDQPNSVTVSTSSGGQGIYEYSITELQTLLNEALNNYTDTGGQGIDEYSITELQTLLNEALKNYTDTGGQGIDEYSITELQTLLNEAWKNYTDTEGSVLQGNFSPSDHDIPVFNGDVPNSGFPLPNSIPIFPDFNASGIFGSESFPQDGFDPNFPPPPLFIPFDGNDLGDFFQGPGLTSTY